jgi:2-dehydro-3-deoxygluconokinase
MLRLATPGHLRLGQSDALTATFGGGEANVAVSLANFGLSAALVTRVPENALGRACVADLRRFGVDTSHILYGGERLGIYFLETGAVARGSAVLYDRNHSAFSRMEPGMVRWEEVLAGASWFHWTGITPAVSAGAAAACHEAIRTANRLGVPVSCDLNYRKNLWKYGKTAGEVMPALVSGCDLILGNEEDCERIFGIAPAGGFDVTATGGRVDGGAFESVCRQMQERFPRAARVVITLRGAINADHNTWGGALFSRGQLLISRRYDITHIVDRVGGGDAFMAGLLYGIQAYADDGRALEFAAAASCLKHTIYGDYNRVTVEEVEKLIAGDASGRVTR